MASKRQRKFKIKTRRRAQRQQRERDWLRDREIYSIVRTPRVLQLEDDDVDININVFLGHLRNLALYGDKPVMLDMHQCKDLSLSACIMLAAEIERCVAMKPGCIVYGRAAKGWAQFMLCVFGFHELLGVDPPKTYGPDATVARICAGGGPDWSDKENPGARTFEVASMATHVLGEKLANRVHSALNEATDNVIGHAYKYPSIIPVKTCIMGRWWVAGFGDPAGGVAYFVVYDQGATIPRTMPLEMDQYVKRVLFGEMLKIPAEAEEDMLLSVVRHKLTTTRKEGRGKGLGHMIGLIDEVAVGAMRIYSGNAYYIYTRLRDNPDARELWGPLRNAIPGTLIVWEVRRTEDGSDEHGADPAS